MISSNKSGNCRLVKKLTQHPQQVSSEPGFNSRQLDSSASPLLREGRAKSYSQGSEVETAFTGQDDLSGLTSNEDVTKDLLYCNLSLAWTTKVFSILFLEQATLIFPSHFEGQNSQVIPPHPTTTGGSAVCEWPCQDNKALPLSVQIHSEI